MTERIILLAGATGLVGGECLCLLSSDNSVKEIRAIVRRPLPSELRLLKVSEYVVDFDKIEATPDIFKVDQVFCALGTTIRKAGSQEVC
jgi:aspartate-semialdehyde dehydrogenase